MAEADALENTPEEQGKPKSSKMLYVIIFAVQIVAAGLLVWFVLLPYYREHFLGEVPQEAVEAVEDSGPKTPGQTYAFGSVTVNPLNGMGRRYATFDIILEVDGEETAALIKDYEVILKDRLIKYFRSKTITELSAVAMMDSAKVEVIAIANGIIGSEGVRDIYFNQFVLQ